MFRSPGRLPLARPLAAALFFLACAVASVPPEALHNIAHVQFPHDSLALQNHRTLSDRYGLPDGYRCSSLIGPRCVSQAALDGDVPVTEFHESGHGLPADLDLSLKILIKQPKPGQSVEDLIAEIAAKESDAYALRQESAALAAGKSKEESAAIGQEAREAIKVSLTEVSKEGMKNFRSLLKKRLLESVAQLTNEVEGLGIEDVDAMREVLLRSLMADLTDEDSFDSQNDGGQQREHVADGVANDGESSDEDWEESGRLFFEKVKSMFGLEGAGMEEEEDEYEDVELEDD
ncbi:unnamed protein product [Ostreobium quekettii]|uniref:Uncharacterized protein n=1 Tax=Ostreobium quekettii TaxID=121088 RepID=A0A8S1J4D4_9CHLO|nr:unnamed protein product [Ostreobium quekettii]|eukprot:evm.model.scf_1465.1 EVM.evm.TU.scf_1465.1   scf_1465:5401-9237(+)